SSDLSVPALPPLAESMRVLPTRPRQVLFLLPAPAPDYRLHPPGVFLRYCDHLSVVSSSSSFAAAPALHPLLLARCSRQSDRCLRSPRLVLQLRSQPPQPIRHYSS